MYYVRLRGKVMGPFPLEHLKALVQRGQVAAFHEISTDGVNWIAAGSLHELFPTAELPTLEPEEFEEQAAPPPREQRYEREPSQPPPRRSAGHHRRAIPHSGLGIASFLIALLVGGLDVILAILTSAIIARSTPVELGASMVSGSVAIVYLNCISVPLCLVGFGLGLVALIAHKNRNHVFSWIGIIGNGVVIAAVVTVFLIAVLSREPRF